MADSMQTPVCTRGGIGLEPLFKLLPPMVVPLALSVVP